MDVNSASEVCALLAESGNQAAVTVSACSGCSSFIDSSVPVIDSLHSMPLSLFVPFVFVCIWCQSSLSMVSLSVSVVIACALVRLCRWRLSL